MSRIALLLLLALVPELAFAQNIFDVPHGDKVMAMLGAIFPGLLSSGNADGMAAAIRTFNGAILIIGGIFATYTILSGTIGTAHDGEMLGKKFSSVWIPIRYMVGTALVLPVISGSYCCMQAIVMWLVTQGVGLADMTWSSYMTTQNLQAAMSTSITPPDVNAFAYKVFESQVCLDLISQAMKDPAATVVNGGSSFGTTSEAGTVNNFVYFGDKNEVSGFTKDSCGTITMRKFSLPAVQTSNIGSYAFNLSDAYSRMRVVAEAHPQLVNNLIATLQPLAQQVANGAVINPAQIDVAASKYSSDILQTAQAQVASMDTFQNISQNATQDGFGTAGNWYVPLASFQDMVNRTAADIPSATGPSGMTNPLVQDQWEHIMSPLQKTLANASVQLTLGVDSQPGGANTSWWSTIKDTVMKGDVTVIIDKVFSSISPFRFVQGESPLMTLSRMGHWVLAAGTTAWAAMFALSSTVGNAPGVGAALLGATLILVPPIIFTGVVLTYILPMIPFLIWVGAIIGFIVLVVEAIVAAPLWAIMHLTPHGDDLMGSGAAGYRLVLSLLLRPFLLVIGLIAGMQMTQVIGEFLNSMFAGSFLLSQTDSGLLVKVFGEFVMSPILWGAMMFTFLKKMFESSVQFADDILNWVGGGGPQLGKFGEDMGGQHSNTFVAAAAVGQTGGRTGEAIRNGTQAKVPQGAPNSQAMKQERMSAQMGAVKESALKQAGPGASPEDKNMAQIKTETRLNHAIKSLGGSDTPEAESFMNSLNSNIEKDPNQPVENHITSAFNRELNRKFGMETGGNLKEISGGSYSGQDFENSLASYNQAWKKLDDSGMKPEDAKKKIEAINVLAKGNYKNEKESVYNSGTKKLSEYLNKEFDKIEVK